jgi:hypothetical protein
MKKIFFLSFFLDFGENCFLIYGVYHNSAIQKKKILCNFNFVILKNRKNYKSAALLNKSYECYYAFLYFMNEILHGIGFIFYTTFQVKKI